MNITTTERQPENEGDLRWGTTNTKLAACLMVLGFRIKQARQPILTTFQRDRENQTSTTIFLEPIRIYKNAEGEDETEAVALYEKAWRDRADFEALNPDHPFTFMRRALEARQWIVEKVIHGTAIKRDGYPPADAFATDDLFLAACLIALRVPIALYQGRSFYFAPIAKPHAEVYAREARGPEPIQWMKTALIQQHELIGAIRQVQGIQSRAQDKRVMHDNGRKGDLFLPVDMPPGPRRALEKKFYD